MVIDPNTVPELRRIVENYNIHHAMSDDFVMKLRTIHRQQNRIGVVDTVTLIDFITVQSMISVCVHRINHL